MTLSPSPLAGTASSSSRRNRDPSLPSASWTPCPTENWTPATAESYDSPFLSSQSNNSGSSRSGFWVFSGPCPCSVTLPQTGPCARRTYSYWSCCNHPSEPHAQGSSPQWRSVYSGRCTASHGSHTNCNGCIRHTGSFLGSASAALNRPCCRPSWRARRKCGSCRPSLATRRLWLWGTRKAAYRLWTELCWTAKSHRQHRYWWRKTSFCAITSFSVLIDSNPWVVGIFRQLSCDLVSPWPFCVRVTWETSPYRL